MTDTPAKKAAASRTPKPDVWEALAAPFPADQIEKLPKVLRRDDQQKGRCEPHPNGSASRFSADGHHCNGWHSRAVHLDYVGHAGITMRLNEVVGPAGWSWEPMATTPEGLPLMGREFWIKLTILDVTKYGVGDDFRGGKEAIGDALRNAAMRFGIATYLWSKSDAAAAMADHTAPAADAPAERQSGTRQQGPTPGPDNAGGPDQSVVRAHVIAAATAADLGALRKVWDQACETGTAHVAVPDPDVDAPAEECPTITVSDFITRRRQQIEAA